MSFRGMLPQRRTLTEIRPPWKREEAVEVASAMAFAEVMGVRKGTAKSEELACIGWFVFGVEDQKKANEPKPTGGTRPKRRELCLVLLFFTHKTVGRV
jgi:hypothetical protein